MSLGKAMISAAAVLFASTAGAFYWRSRNAGNEEYVQKTILTPEGYKDTTHKIRARFSDKYWPELRRSRESRRRCHPDSGEYQTCVLNFQKTIKRLIDESTTEILAQLRLSKEIFEESVNFYSSDPDLKEFGENLINPIHLEMPPTKLSMNETNRILQLFSSKLREKNSECLDLDEFLVITSQIEDEIYKAYRIEIEEVNHAFEKYKDHLEDVVESMKLQTSSIIASSDNSF